MAEYVRRIDKILAPEHVAGLEARSLDEIRALRKEASEVETEVSYVRRLAQARGEILKAEITRRSEGGSLADLIARLPEILSDRGPRPAPASVRMRLLVGQRYHR